jgi:hypothetical protein
MKLTTPLSLALRLGVACFVPEKYVSCKEMTHERNCAKCFYRDGITESIIFYYICPMNRG